MSAPSADLRFTTVGPRLHVALNDATSTEMWFGCPVQMRRIHSHALVIFDADRDRNGGDGREVVRMEPRHIDALAAAIEALAPHTHVTDRRPKSIWRHMDETS